MADTMKTLVVAKDGSLSVQEVARPTYTKTQALVKTLACGICNGTDAKLIHGNFKGFGPERYPLMLGHEGVGEVVEVGAAVRGLQPGDKVLLPFVDPDPIRIPGLDSGWGAYSEYGVVHDVKAYPEGEAPEVAYAQTVLPAEVDPVDAVMIVTLREVLSAIQCFGMKAGDPVLLFGLGPVGLTFLRFLKLLGVGPVLACDIKEEKRAEALAFGADAFINSGTEDVTAAVRAQFPDGVPYVLDASGYLPLINLGMFCLSDRGKICCYGISPETHMDLDWGAAPYNWQLQFQQFPRKDEEGAATEQILSWMRAGEINLKDYISDYFPFADILHAFELLAEGKISKKGIVVY